MGLRVRLALPALLVGLVVGLPAAEFGGIGCRVGAKDNVIVVVEVFDGTPAARAGLKPGDQIVKVGGQSFDGAHLDDAVALMRGAVGTSVTLTIVIPGAAGERQIELVRAGVTAPPDPLLVADLYRSKLTHATYVNRHNCLFAAAYSPDGTWLAIGSQGGQAVVWDLNGETNYAIDVETRDPVNGLTWSPDGQQFAMVTDDGVLSLHERQAGEVVWRTPMQEAALVSIAWSPDGRRLAAGGADGKIRLWDVGSRAVVATLEGHQGDVSGLAFAPGGELLASGAADGTVRLWSVAEAKAVGLLRGHSAPVRSVAFGPAGRLASAGWDRTVRVWQTPGGDCLKVIEGFRDRLWAVGFSSTGAVLGVAEGEYRQPGCLSLIDAESGAITRRMIGSGGAVRSIAFNPRAGVLVTGNDDGSVDIWSEQRADTSVKAEPVDQVAGVGLQCVQAEGKLLVAGVTADSPAARQGFVAGDWVLSIDGQRIHDGEEAAALLAGEAGSEVVVRRLGAGRTLAEDCRLVRRHTPVDDKIVLPAWPSFTPSAGQIAVLEEDAGRRVTQVRMTHDGRMLVSSSYRTDPPADGEGLGAALRTWTLGAVQELTGKEPAIKPAAQQEGWPGVNDQVWNSSGSLFAVAADSGEAAVFMPELGQQLAKLETADQIIERLALSPNEKLLAGLTDQQKVRLWTVEDGKPAEQQPPEGDYSAVMFVSDTVLAMGHWQGITLWDMQQNTSRELKGPQGFTYALALGKNQVLAAGGNGESVYLWSLPTFESLGVLRSHGEDPNQTIHSLDFSADDHLLAAGCADTSVLVWERIDRELVATLAGHAEDVVSVAFHPQGPILASGSWDGTVRLWDLGELDGLDEYDWDWWWFF